MSSSPNQLPRISPESAASREDLQLFRRLLRVARLLGAHELDDLVNQGPAPTQYGPQDGLARDLVDPSLVPITPATFWSAPGMSNDFDDGNDYDCCDDDDDDDDDKEAGGAEPDAAAMFGRPLTRGENGPKRKLQDGQQKKTKAPAQRQRLQQQQQQQQQPLMLQHPPHRMQQSPQQLLQQLPPQLLQHPQQLQQHTQQLQQQQPQQQEQKQQRHHAAVEKRYRSVLNSKIQQLSSSIPPSNTFTPTAPNTPPEEQDLAATQKTPTKSVVMDRAIQYINHLVSTYEQCETERNELRQKLQLWLDETPAP